MLTMCFACLWISMILLFLWSALQALKHGITHLKTLHQVPCSKCDFFTNDYRLKCTVHPIKSCTEQAINCVDFEPKTKAINTKQRSRWKLRKFM